MVNIVENMMKVGPYMIRCKTLQKKLPGLFNVVVRKVIHKWPFLHCVGFSAHFSLGILKCVTQLNK